MRVITIVSVNFLHVADINFSNVKSYRQSNVITITLKLLLLPPPSTVYSCWTSKRNLLLGHWITSLYKLLDQS